MGLRNEKRGSKVPGVTARVRHGRSPAFFLFYWFRNGNCLTSGDAFQTSFDGHIQRPRVVGGPVAERSR